ncbi:chloride channel protein [Clostridium weizhouense]|uniref:Chloride channel protein n=1 Tax=Clostridium weizhouense TaxID=2859781 RepID=A0ABS7ANM1_9CLOT|nr:chloride channel protein [Clostridium weizhouense]MBW6409678.1 chloride channel protein [Clostridium weizhouense]
MNKTIRIDLEIIIYSIVMGGMVGFLTWLFLSVVNLGIHFMWNTLPNYFNTNYWTLIIGIIGGILVGLTQKYFGDYPKFMNQTLGEFKQNKKVEYKSVPKATIAALTVLFFGASLGPEAALTGIIGGIITFVGDKMNEKFKKNNIINEYADEITQSSMQASIGMIFNAPLFGVYTLGENSDKDKSLIKKIKTIIYTVTTIAGFSVFILLSQIDNREGFIVKFGECKIGRREILFGVILLLIAILVGIIYKMYGKVLHKLLKAFEDKKIVKAIIGGISIGIIGTLLPYTLFSGEHELKKLVFEWNSIGAYMLIIIGLIKLLLTEICLSTGWRGGHIFPIIFSGSCIGYGLSILFGIDPVFSVVVVTTCFVSKAMDNMVIPMILLIFFFPLNTILPMILSAAIGKLSNNVI